MFVGRSTRRALGCCWPMERAARSRAPASPPEAQTAYSEYYCQIDYVLDAVEKGPPGLIRSGQPLVALNARSSSTRTHASLPDG